LRTRESVVSAECGAVMVKVKDSEREKDQKGIAIEREREKKGICNWMTFVVLTCVRRCRQKGADFTLLLISERKRR